MVLLRAGLKPSFVPLPRSFIPHSSCPERNGWPRKKSKTAVKPPKSFKHEGGRLCCEPGLRFYWCLHSWLGPRMPTSNSAGRCFSTTENPPLQELFPPETNLPQRFRQIQDIRKATSSLPYPESLPSLTMMRYGYHHRG